MAAKLSFCVYLKAYSAKSDVFSELATVPIFSNGAVHWEICGRLLVYNVQADYCKLINLPTEWCCQSASIYKRCFWESDGQVHYSYTDCQGVHTWVLLNEFDLAYYSKLNTIDCKEEFPWKLADSLHYQTLKENNPEIFKQGNNWETHYLSPFAYNEASRTMYLQLPGIVVSYNTKTRVLQRVCTFKFLGKDFNCCSFLPFVYSGQGQSSEAEIVLELPVREVVSSLSF
ncbi:hypothetical protein LWI28_016009 [Acer negundo]|uniref:Uncharacterized protein n=1 Tax=Acer negundo TaxID=4023 RepID=A0AAD5JHW5_ACENE|nr:hypothetical protein LWI28_016009 [Acer negundo]